MSLPTTSDPTAMQDQPQARRRELAALLDLIELQEGMTVLDLQAAGGFVADAIYARLAGRVTCICVEPSAALRARIRTEHQRCADPIHRMSSVSDASVDAVVGLAGLHHSAAIPETLVEVRRVLRPGGAFVVCDVEAGSRMERWLNDFVAMHNPTGHEGRFLTRTALQAALITAGFAALQVAPRAVPWHFSDAQAARTFLRGLFGLQCDDQTLCDGMREFLDCRYDGTAYSVGWELVYAYAVRPGEDKRAGRAEPQ